MKPSELTLENREIEAIRMITAFINKQHDLACNLRQNLSEHADVLSLKKYAPRTIDASNETWAVAIHGVGARFANLKTGEVIDAHVGLLDSPDAFDAWRLGEYAESIHSNPGDFGPILEQLASKGVILRHESLANHYELPVSFVT